MEEHSYLENYSDDDIISFSDTRLVKVSAVRRELVRIFELIERDVKSIVINSGARYFPNCRTKIKDKNGQYLDYDNGYVKLEDGIYSFYSRCEILKLGFKNWQKGQLKLKVKPTFEFEPDEPEIPPSPLDDIRREMNQQQSSEGQ